MSYNPNSSNSNGSGTIAQIPDRRAPRDQQPTYQPQPNQNQPSVAYNSMQNAPPRQAQVQQQQPPPNPQFNSQNPAQGQTSYMQQQPYAQQGYYNPQQQQQQQQQQQNYSSQYQPQQPQGQQPPPPSYAPQPRQNNYTPQTQNQYPPQPQPQQMSYNQNPNMYMNNAMQQSAPMSQQSMATSRKKVMLKLVILGNSGVGKTSLMHRYHSNKFTGQYKATIGADFLSKSLSLPANPNSPPQQVTLTIWDTAGQERFQSLGKAFYRGSDACILVYDVTDRSSFDELKKWKEEFDSCLNGGSPGGRSSLMHNRLQHGHPLGRNMSEVKFIVVGNKADKDASGRVVDAKEGAAYANSIGGEFYEGSAKTAMNVEQAFVAAAKAGLEYNNRLQMTTSMMNGAGNAGMPGYVPPQRTVDLKRGNTSGFGDDVCC